jgi:flagellar motor switch protein FliG
MILNQAEDRLALLLHLLGADVAATLLDEMRPERAAELRRRIESLQNVSLSARKQEEVLADFERLFQLAGRRRGPRLRIAAAQPEQDDSADEHAASWEPFEPGDNPQSDLSRLTPYQIASCLETEHPRTAAIVFKHLPAQLAAKVMRLLSDEKREATIVQLSGTIPDAPALTSRVLHATVQAGVKLPPAPRKTLDAVQRIADMLRATEKAQRGPLIEALKEHQPDTAAQVVDRLYVFEDIEKLDNRVIQRVLAEVDTATLAMALTGAAESLSGKVSSNLSKRARDTLRDEMEFQSSARPDAVAGARKTIAQVLAKVDQEDG